MANTSTTHRPTSKARPRLALLPEPPIVAKVAVRVGAINGASPTPSVGLPLVGVSGSVAGGGLKPEAAGVFSRVAWNFLSMGAAEVACRATSVVVTLSLARELGRAGYGRIGFAFNVVFWLVLLVRNGSEVIAARELARHPRLVRPMVNHFLAIKIAVAAPLYLALVLVGWLAMSDAIDRTLLMLYGLMLVTTALGLDFVYRGVERMGLLAISLYLRTAVFALGVWFCVTDSAEITAVPAWLAAGEALGIALVWFRYVREYGVPIPMLTRRFLGVFARRCRPVLMIQVAQTVLGSIDLMVVGLLRSWDDVGFYGAPHQMIAAALTFGMIFLQVIFPTLARSWRDTPEAGRRAIDSLVRALAIGMIPLAVGTTILSGPLVASIFPKGYAGGGTLLALGIWRVPLLTLAFLYQTALIARNRESTGAWTLMFGAIVSGPLVAGLLFRFGLLGASAGLLAIALILVAAGYMCLARELRQPSWHHHLLKPTIAASVMVPVCLSLLPFHLLAAIVGGAMAYAVALTAIGGLRRDDLRPIFGPRCSG